MVQIFLQSSAFLLQAQSVQAATTTNDGITLVSWVIGFVVAIGVLALVARPLLMTSEGGIRRRVRLEQAQEQSKLDALYERAAVERKSLEELEFDHELGNLLETDYAALKQKTETTLANLEVQIKQQKQIQAEIEQRRQPRREPKMPIAARKVAETVPALKTTRPVARPETEGRLKAKPAVKEAMKCSECTTPFKPGDRFCSKCGAPLPHLCLNCGSELKDDARFCAKCGAAVND